MSFVVVFDSLHGRQNLSPPQKKKEEEEDKKREEEEEEEEEEEKEKKSKYTRVFALIRIPRQRSPKLVNLNELVRN